MRASSNEPVGASIGIACFNLTQRDLIVEKLDEAAAEDERITTTDDRGTYQFAALPVGYYRLEINAAGFGSRIVERLEAEVATVVVQNFQLEVGDVAQMVQVPADVALVELATTAVGQVINERTVQEIPLNGRYFIDLGLLVPGSVTPPQNGFLSSPTRGGGSLALNTAGNREDTINFQINGISLNDQVNNILHFNPPLASIQEFKIDNSTFSAEHGRNSGAVVNVATRSGSRDFHGELYEFFRNNALDARNFFNFVSNEPPPFKRNQFGGAIGGPIKLPRFGEGGPVFREGKPRAFFFFTYEVLRQRQGVDLNSLVLSDAQRQGNFRDLAAPHRGREFSDSEIYKLLEALAWEYGRSQDREINDRFERIADREPVCAEPAGRLRRPAHRQLSTAPPPPRAK